MPQPALAPPRWARAVVRAALPDDPMGDAIVGDLHEEFVSDVERLGPLGARAGYCRRAAGIVAYAALDVVRWSRWASTPPPGEASPSTAPARLPARLPALAARARVGRADAGLGALALGVLLVGIVANTLLFTSVRHAPPTAEGSAVWSALGLGATALALTCAAAAAVVLCAGPRWLRRRRGGAPGAAPAAVPNATPPGRSARA